MKKENRIKEVYNLISHDIDNLSNKSKLLTPNGFIKKKANDYKISISDNLDYDLTKEEITDIYLQVVEDKNLIITQKIIDEKDINDLLEKHKSKYRYNDIIIDLYDNYKRLQALIIDLDYNILEIGLYNKNDVEPYYTQNFSELEEQGIIGEEYSYIKENIFNLKDSYIIKNNLTKKGEIYLFGNKIELPNNFYYIEPQEVGQRILAISAYNEEKNREETVIIFDDGTYTNILDGRLELNFTTTGSITTYQNYDGYLYGLTYNNPEVDNSGKYNEFILMYKDKEIYKGNKNFYITDDNYLVFYYRDKNYNIISEIYYFNKNNNDLEFITELNYPILNSIDIKNGIYLSEIYPNQIINFDNEKINIQTRYDIIQLLKETNYFIGIDNSGNRILLENTGIDKEGINVKETKLKGTWIIREGNTITAYGERWGIKGQITIN